jgi:hypothetical protein
VAAEGHDPERVRRHVEQDHVVAILHQRGALNRGADRHHLVRVDAAVRLAPEELRDGVLDRGHAGHAADQDHVLDLVDV